MGHIWFQPPVFHKHRIPHELNEPRQGIPLRTILALGQGLAQAVGMPTHPGHVGQHDAVTSGQFLSRERGRDTAGAEKRVRQGLLCEPR
eukprot:1298399-Lingulodinium_polyedra.AAC.1